MFDSGKPGRNEIRRNRRHDLELATMMLGGFGGIAVATFPQSAGQLYKHV
jgi:hypothetical protein